MNIYFSKLSLKGFCITLSTVMILLASSWVQAAEVIQTARYITTKVQPKPEQVDLLSSIIQVHFLSEVKTVGDAIHSLLQYSGYSLVETKQQSRDLQNTLKKQLPLIDRDLGPISLREGLELLIGPAFDLVVDPLNRTINFQLRPEYMQVNQLG
jgi:conjugative transfer region protein (TIGR03748 family)